MSGNQQSILSQRSSDQLTPAGQRFLRICPQWHPIEVFYLKHMMKQIAQTIQGLTVRLDTNQGMAW